MQPTMVVGHMVNRFPQVPTNPTWRVSTLQGKDRVTWESFVFF